MLHLKAAKASSRLCRDPRLLVFVVLHGTTITSPATEGGGASILEHFASFRLVCEALCRVEAGRRCRHMLKKIFAPACIAIAIFAAIPTAQSHVQRRHSNPDLLTYIPPHYDIRCPEARVLLQKEGYHISKTIRCGGNYHRFRAERRGFQYIVQVMTNCGKRMIDARSGSRAYRLRMASY